MSRFKLKHSFSTLNWKQRLSTLPWSVVQNWNIFEHAEWWDDEKLQPFDATVDEPKNLERTFRIVGWGKANAHIKNVFAFERHPPRVTLYFEAMLNTWWGCFRCELRSICADYTKWKKNNSVLLKPQALLLSNISVGYIYNLNMKMFSPLKYRGFHAR